MATYFLDTSVIIKRYIFEPGQAWILSLCNPARGEMFPGAHGSPGGSGAWFRSPMRSTETPLPMLLRSPLELHKMSPGVAKSSFLCLLLPVDVPEPSILSLSCFRRDFSLIALVLS